MKKCRGFSIVETLFVIGITSVVATIAVPMMLNTLGDYRLRGDARSLTNAVSLAKMRAASDFTQSRLYVDLGTKNFHLETWQKTGTPAWVSESGATVLSGSDAFGYGVVGTPPANTQGAIGQGDPCRTGIAAGGNIANTACIVFNSRGIPVDATGAPTASGALYITDNTAVYGVTISATGLIRLWRTKPAASPTWVLQ